MRLVHIIERINVSSTDFLFEVFDAPSHVHVGKTNIGEIYWRHAFAEIAVLIGERGFQNLGYATDALQLTINSAFREFEFPKLIAGIH
jgi:RimJ/RimL family protein N-acetyltransferase